mgnify:FL=1
MEEKTYKLLGGSGALNIAVGAVVLVSGIASGVLLIVNGARQLAHRGKLIFTQFPVTDRELRKRSFSERRPACAGITFLPIRGNPKRGYCQQCWGQCP